MSTFTALTRMVAISRSAMHREAVLCGGVKAWASMTATQPIRCRPAADLTQPADSNLLGAWELEGAEHDARQLHHTFAPLFSFSSKKKRMESDSMDSIQHITPPF